jgi:hypothetical protein
MGLTTTCAHLEPALGRPPEDRVDILSMKRKLGGNRGTERVTLHREPPRLLMLLLMMLLLLLLLLLELLEMVVVVEVRVEACSR